MPTKKKTDEEILFPEKTIAGIKIKPWSFGELFIIADPLDRILDKIEESGLSEKLIDEEGEIQFDYLSLAKLFTLASKELLSVISSTLRVDEEVVKNLSAPDGISIVMHMFNQNKEMLINAIKNAFSSPPKKTALQKKIQEKKEGEPKKKETK